MTALSNQKARRTESWKHRSFTLTAAKKAYKGANCVLDTATGKVKPGAAGTGLVLIGVFDETVDATSAGPLGAVAQPVSVDLLREVNLEWFANDTGTAVSGTTGLLQACYVLDDQTVSGASSGNSIAGLVWAVDSVKGVAVERVPPGSAGPNLVMGVGTLAAYTSNDTAPTAIVSGDVYDVPATGAASTISLPTAPTDGTWAMFTADGTKNGHTVQYRDVTTAITTALTASKRHLVIVTALGGKWFANAYVSP